MRTVKPVASLAVAVLMSACGGPAAEDSPELSTQAAALTTAVSRGCTFSLSYLQAPMTFPPRYDAILTRQASASCPWGEASTVVGSSYNTPALSLAASDLGVAVSYTNKYSLSGSSTGVWLELRHLAPDTLTVVRSTTLTAGQDYRHTPIYSGELSLRTDTTGTALIVRGEKVGTIAGETGSGPYYTATYLNFFTSTNQPIITASAEAQRNPFVVTGLLTIPRESHTATLLNSTSEVLVVGNDTAEIYNPYVHQAWPTGTPHFPRFKHAATWLQASGKVLVTGGFSGPGGVPQASAELYDAATGTWSLAAPMSIPRANHTATVLDSGKVLVVGGNSTNGDTNTAELYDPETNTWSSAGEVYMPRSVHTATLLYSGKVLVTGGSWQFLPFSDPQDAHLYDPATNTWTVVGAMSRGRTNHLAIRLFSGLVMVLGGGDDAVDLYDPYNNLWTQGPSLPYGRLAVTMTIMYSGQLLVTQSNGQASLYDPATNAWSSAGNLSAPLQAHTGTLMHTGEVLVTGGSTNGTATRTVQWYKP
jgi:N-acetylneuraminic acid mutarotase